MKETGLINKAFLENIFNIVFDIQCVQNYHMFMIHERFEKMNRNEAAAIIEERDRWKVTLEDALASYYPGDSLF